jgi:hypothetical protein
MHGQLYEKRQLGVRTGMMNWRPVIGGLDRRVDTKLPMRFNFDRENRKGFSFDCEILIGWAIKKRRRGRQLVIAISPRRGMKTV